MKIPKVQTIKLICSLRKTPISGCVNIFGVKFDHSHHLVKTVLQIISQPNIKFKETDLYKYHKNFCPKTTNEALKLENLERIYQVFCYPWGQFNKYRKLEKNILNSRFCGPTTDEDIFKEFIKLKGLLYDISDHGYRPIRNRSIIFGTRLIRDKEIRFIPMQGNHRISVLSALNFRSLYVGQHQNYHQNIAYINNPKNCTQRDHNQVIDRFFK